MPEDEPQDNTRHSKALDATLILDEDERAAREVANGLRQIDAVVEMVDYYVENKLPFKLRVSHLLNLHRTALDGISSYAGNFRPSGIEIGGSQRQPVGAHLVPEKLEELVDYVNEYWTSASALHLAAYTLWRLNWIHPFTDGNGRIARATAYLVLCLKIGYPIYGSYTVPEQISEDKRPYYEALEAADAAEREGRIDVSRLEILLDSLLARQLLRVLENARGSAPTGTEPAS